MRMMGKVELETRMRRDAAGLMCGRGRFSQIVIFSGRSVFGESTE